MASVNKHIIVGNLGNNPDLRTFPSGDRIATISIATTDRWRDKKTSEMREATEWHRVILRNGLADIASKYLTKGSSVYVEGSSRTNRWTDDRGIDRYTTEVHATALQMLDKKPSSADSTQASAPQRQQAQPPQQPAPPAQNPNDFPDLDDDIPG